MSAPVIDLSFLADIVDRPRPLTIYKRPCPPCPSTKDFLDPEVEDIKTWPREHQLDTVFVCAWRKTKNCKGYCDELGVTEAELRASTEKRSKA